jgi:microcystin-dependent protein
MEVYLGTILLFGFSFAPRGFAFCSGQLVAISQNDALFSLLGTQFGGDGRTTFALPDLRGRVPCGMGQGPGLPDLIIGQQFGQFMETLTTLNLPEHTHLIQEKTAGQTVTVKASDAQANKVNPQGGYWAKSYSGSAATPSYSDTSDVTMASDAVQLSISNLINSDTGGSQGFGLSQPTLTINFSIATVGLYPSRD